MSTIRSDRYVLTGGPGSGKTSLIDALAAAGYRRSSEVGREIIQEQVAGGGRALPWVDPMRFAEAMLQRELLRYESLVPADGPIFFDRGVPDVLGYLRVSGLTPTPSMLAAAGRVRYNRRVFILPPWPEIYAQDTERKQDLDEAIRTCDAMRAVYPSLGYELIEVPPGAIAARRDFVLREIGARASDA